MKSKRWILFSGLAILLLAVGAGILVWMNRPMGKSLTLQTPSQEIIPSVEQQVSTQTSAPLEERSTVIVPTSTVAESSLSSRDVKTCGNSGSMRLLVLGLTTPTEDEILAADAIRLVTINFDQPSAAIMTLPAMLWVDTPVLADLGVKEIQLSVVYYKAYLAAEGDPERDRNRKATQAMAQTIIDNFGYVPDHYITVDEGAFIKYVDALGGIQINLPEAVDGTLEGYGIYPAGTYILDGTRTLNFTRLFHPGGVRNLDAWGNLDRQDMVVRGILQATLKPSNWTKIPGQMIQVRKAVITDLSLNQTLDLACMVEKVGKSTRMLVIDEGMVELDNLGNMIPKGEAILDLIVEMDRSD